MTNHDHQNYCHTNPASKSLRALSHGLSRDFPFLLYAERSLGPRRGVQCRRTALASADPGICRTNHSSLASFIIGIIYALIVVTFMINVNTMNAIRKLCMQKIMNEKQQSNNDDSEKNTTRSLQKVMTCIRSCLTTARLDQTQA